jgi:hypothetical protein
MEAPKKIYIDANEDWHRTYTTFIEKAKGDDIEYVRTDVFIKKACEAYCKVCKMPNCRSNECKWISDFKRHLETI